MKRFYKNAEIAKQDGGYAVTLDGRDIKTPQRSPLVVPGRALALAIAAEWQEQGEEILPETMPMTALAHGALDQLTKERSRIVGRIAGFADSDMLYYRPDEGQPDLAAHQQAQWNPLLDWARNRYDISFVLIEGIMHRPQPENTISTLLKAVDSYDNFTLAAMLSLVGLSASLIVTLALVEGAYDAQTLWPLINLEELWQEKQWGQDDEAMALRAKREQEFLISDRFLKILSEKTQ